MANEELLALGRTLGWRRALAEWREKNLPIDLADADLSDNDFSGTKLQGADLHGAELFRAKFCEANLSQANLTGADMCRADLSRATLWEADLTGADLSGATVFLTNFSKAILVDVNLADAKQMARASFFQARMLPQTRDLILSVIGSSLQVVEG